MWVCLNDGFISAVEDYNDKSRLVVRARHRAILDRLFPSHTVVTSEDSDYRHRVFITREEFRSVMDKEIQRIDYDNFKDSVGDHALARLYGKFWKLHRDYQWMYPGK